MPKQKSEKAMDFVERFQGTKTWGTKEKDIPNVCYILQIIFEP